MLDSWHGLVKAAIKKAGLAEQEFIDLL